jgi:hypothetical protein
MNASNNDEIDVKVESQPPKADWQHIIAQWQSSGLSQVKFCRIHHLEYNQFAYQRLKLKNNYTKNQAKSKLLPINLLPDYPVNSSENAFILQLPSGIKLSIPTNAKIDSIKCLLSCLGLC